MGAPEATLACVRWRMQFKREATPLAARAGRTVVFERPLRGVVGYLIWSMKEYCEAPWEST